MIYFDEAGNSGDNLLDSDQTVYTLVSHNYSEEEATAILSELLKESKADELHFKNLRKYSKYRTMVLAVLNNELIEKQRVFHYVGHKEFMIVAHLVDQLIEPVLHDGGIDIYKEGLNLSTSNIIYILGSNVWDKELFKNMCACFVSWARSVSEHDSIVFYAAVNKLLESVKGSTDKLLIGLIAKSQRFKESIEYGLGKYTLDITLSCLVAHCQHWADICQNPFNITFDASKQIDYWRDRIEYLSKELPPAEVGYGSRKYKYPLLIDNFKTESSKHNMSLQLADLFASSINFCYNTLAKGNEDEFCRAIWESKINETRGNSIWPTTMVTPEQLDMTDTAGVNPLDFIAENIMKNPGKYSRLD